MDKSMSKNEIGYKILTHCKVCDSDVNGPEDFVCRSMRHSEGVAPCQLYPHNSRSKLRISTLTEMIKAVRRYCRACGYRGPDHCSDTNCAFHS